MKKNLCFKWHIQPYYRKIFRIMKLMMVILLFFCLKPIEKALDSVVAVTTIQDKPFLFLLKILEGDIGRDLPVPCLLDQLLHQSPGNRFCPWLHDTLLDGFILIRDDLFFVKDGQVAKAVAPRTGPLRAVEREEVGKRILVQNSTCLTLKRVREDKFLPDLRTDLRFSIALFQSKLEGIDQPIPLLSVEDHPVHQDIDVVFFPDLNLVDVHDFAVF